MSSVRTVLETDNPIFNVFGSLDAYLTRDQVEEAENCDEETIRKNSNDYPRTHDRALSVVLSSIHETSSTQYWDCPLREELEKFQIYDRHDMADALCSAYYFWKRGGNPVEALEADYSLKPHGLLRWGVIDQEREAARNDKNAPWWKLDHMYQEGDRLIHYRLPAYSGLLLVRGVRLVSEFRSGFRDITDTPIRQAWMADYEHFLSLGGNRGFLAGDFDWPDPDWVNPFTFEWEKSYWSTKDEEL